MQRIVLLMILLLASSSLATAQTTTAGKESQTELELLREGLRQMRQQLEQMEARINTLEAEKKMAQTIAPTASASTATLTKEDRNVLDFWRDTTFNLMVDGYYGYNFNRPVGGVNLLRAYDVTSNSFSLNQ
ncbi:MAG: hypothetical protein U0X75_27855, partial [Acidobacteriota bacterium]